MRREPRYVWFTRLFIFWMGKQNFKRPVQTIRDNRLDCLCCIDNWNDPERICLKYHSKKISREPQYMLINCVFHEIGHLVNMMPYTTKEEMILSERRAEQYAIRMMKKHYPKQYKQLLNYMTKHQVMKELEKEEPLYYNAYIKIKDYRKTIKE